MNPIAMSLLLLVGWGVFAYSVRKRWQLMMVGTAASRFDQPGRRFVAMFKYAFAQMRMRRYPISGFAHLLVFVGFAVLLLRTLVLWGRGFDPSFDLWILNTDHLLGQAYAFLKDVFAVLVFLGALVFLYYRTVKKLKRLTHSVEGIVILIIILVMMAADVFYDGATIARDARWQAADTVALAPMLVPNPPAEPSPSRSLVIETSDGEVSREDQRKSDPFPGVEGKSIGYLAEPDSPVTQEPSTMGFVPYEPAGSLAAIALQGMPDDALSVIAHMGFWTHSALVLIFLNLLPYSKHFHIITAIPNVYLQDLEPPGKLPNLDDIEGKLEREETLGIKRIDQFSWKSILDFYTCTECGRCSDHCPATKTGKKLSPKHFTIDLRDFLYKQEDGLVAANANGQNESDGASDETETRPSGSGQNATDGSTGEANSEHLKDLVDGVIDPEVLWACTTCRACEQECPVFISYVDKIVDMRRYLVQERSEFPTELQTAFRGLESNANPWSFPASERAAWADGLGVKTIAEHPDAAVLFWVGCAPSFDERAKRVAVATVKLMQQAGVDFAILGQEEQCTGDPARRAGNEYLFQMFATANVEVLNGYGVDKKKIVTTCPHCFNTLLNEYPDFGGRYDVVHHTTFLAGLIESGKLNPTKPIEKRIVYHDSCYLGRYNEVYDAPRDALRSIPGVTLVEPEETRDRGMCCGAGGAQMFKEEEPGDERINIVRTGQLLDTKPDAIASGCPFCQRMLTDGLGSKDREDVPQLDIAELLLESVDVETAGDAS